MCLSSELSGTWHGVRGGGMLILCGFLGYCLLSTVWSDEGFITFKRSFALLLEVLICYGAFGRSDAEGCDFIDMTGVPLMLILIMSTVFTVVRPDVALKSGGMEGYFGSKNGFGGFCSISLLCAVCTFGRWRYRYCLPMVALSAVGLILSERGRRWWRWRWRCAWGVLAVSIVEAT